MLVLCLQTPALGSDAEDRLRLAQLLGTARSDGFLLRSDGWTVGRPTLQLISPTILTIYNSSLPFSLNDGALWAGRGWNATVTAGFRAQWGRVTLIIDPEFVSSDNESYAMPPPAVELPRPAGRNAYSTPWHVGAYSIDLPLRFGARGFARIDPGQSTLAVRVGAMSVGFSTENEWWGPGIRNAIVMSDNAPGIPRAFVRAGGKRVAVRWFLGGLSESPYFDSTSANDRRSITGLAATWTPATNLTLGATRVVYAPLHEWLHVFDHAFDVLNGSKQRDQIFSLFGRWVFPADGFAVHGEWARNQLPGSLRELFVSPDHSEGYTLGLEWARGFGNGTALRAQTEVTYLEKSPAYRNLTTETWYTGAAAQQGYTQRGQVIGAAIGPGASSQFLAGDYFAPRWRTGIFLGRIRWDNDALYLFPSATPKRFAHDVTIFAGVRGQWRQLAGTLTLGRRLNPSYDANTTLGNTTLELRFTP